MIRKTAWHPAPSGLIALTGTLLLLAAAALTAGAARAQAIDPAQAPGPAPALDPDELEDLVAPIALYPDDLLGIILPASTFPLDIVRAARFLDDLEDDPNLEPDPAWDDSIVALLNYPEVLRMMNEDIDWTWELGEAVLTNQGAVLDAAQAFRRRAYVSGNLRTDDKQVVATDEGAIEIKPVDPKIVYVPVYEPAEVVIYHDSPFYHYYPIGYPSYYYPYPIGYFGADLFWGVTSYFSIGWQSHFLHVRYYTERLHPYYDNIYYTYTPYYPRNHVHITVTVNNYTDVWQPRPRRGDRPRSITREGRSSVRAARSTTVETQPGVASRQRSATTSESRTLGGIASSSRRESTREPSTTRSVESPAVTTSQLRGVRDREATTATRRSEPSSIQPVSPQSLARQPATRQPETRQPQTRQPNTTPRPTTRQSTIAAPRSSSSRSSVSGSAFSGTRSSSSYQSTTRRTETRSAPTPSSSSTVRSSSGQRTVGAVRQSTPPRQSSTPRPSSPPRQSAPPRQNTSSPRSQGATRSSAASASSSSSRSSRRER